MEASVGLHCELFDSNSRFLSKLREEDISEGFRFYTGECDEPYPPLNHFSHDNTLNFADIQQRLSSEKHNTNTPFHHLIRSIDTEEVDWAPNDSHYKRGLKNLASLLLKAFHKKRFTSLAEVIEEIESQLLPHSSPSEV